MKFNFVTGIPAHPLRNLGMRLLAASFALLMLHGFSPESGGASPTVKPSEIPAVLTEKGRTLTALKAVMNVKSSYDDGKSQQDIKGFLLYRRPDDFRFQGLGPGGNSLFELVIKSARFELYIPAESKIIRGPKTCFGRRFPDVAEIEGLIPMILYQWRGVAFDKLVSSEAGNITIRLKFEGRIWGATLDPEKLLLKRLVRLGPDGRIDLTAEFGDFSSGDYGWLPRRFEVRSPTAGWRTIVRITKFETNPFLLEKHFKLEPVYSPKIEECR
ncbi:MAG: hypothetical protein RDU20_06965 [Desulfomonilaceae bacterium]|nr:hypothetical protein [Desulfomonilaceae bacterium]